MSTHERISRREDFKPGSERSFGFVLAAAFLLLAVLKWWRGSEYAHLWLAWLALSVVLATIAASKPQLLRLPNRAWLNLGLLLHRVVTPAIMALMFYIVITPMGFFMRLKGKDMLRLRIDPQARSYWIDRDPPGPAAQTMKYQF